MQERHWCTEVTKPVRGLQHLEYKEGLWNLDLFSLEKNRPRGDIIVAYNVLIAGNREYGVRLFSEVHSRRTWGYRHKLEHRRILDKKKISYCEVVKHWSRLRRGVVESPSMEILKISLNMAVSHLLKLPRFG